MIGDQWGVSDAEVRRRYGCDDLVSAPTLEAWRGVTVHAEPTAVWARLRQVRLAPYSYDLLDNLGRRSPRELRDLPEPRPGDPFTRALGRHQGRILAVDPGRELTATIMGAHLSYAVEPGERGTRLLLKVVTRTRAWLAPALSLGDLLMARKQLLTLKALAEQDARRAGRG
ncbi:polyketide cyclase [Nocardia sp. N13]|uniref:polyketide cyclase n=1 Tax=Nocardioides sp. N13(2025) TaxID=3453405 RepID=UPI003F7612EE